MKLGELLIRDGRLSEAQLEQAIERQTREGGRLGTILAEMDCIDLETLTVYLGLELAIPIATGATLERAKKTAVKLLSAQDAARFRCVPIVIQHRQLIAAIDDPHDIRALDELSQATGYRVVPRVAPEIRIYYYLERYYGVPRPARFAPLGDTPRGSRDSRTDPHLPAPPLPGLPPPQESPVPAPSPAPALRERRRPDTIPPPPPAAREVVLEAEDLVEVLEADNAEAAEGVAPRPPTAVEPQGAEPTPTPPDEPRPRPLSIDEAIVEIREAQNRRAIADAIMAYAAGIFDVATLLIVRDNLAFGWRVHGARSERIESLLIPLDSQSIFQMAIHSGAPYQTHAFPSTLHDYLFKVLQCIRPAFSFVGAVKIKERTVNLLYGHRSEPIELSPIVLSDMQKLCAAAAVGYQRLIARSRGHSAEMRAQPDPSEAADAPDADTEEPKQKKRASSKSKGSSKKAKSGAATTRGGTSKRTAKSKAKSKD